MRVPGPFTWTGRSIRAGNGHPIPALNSGGKPGAEIGRQTLTIRPGAGLEGSGARRFRDRGSDAAAAQ